MPKATTPTARSTAGKTPVPSAASRWRLPLLMVGLIVVLIVAGVVYRVTSSSSQMATVTTPMGATGTGINYIYCTPSGNCLALANGGEVLSAQGYGGTWHLDTSLDTKLGHSTVFAAACRTSTCTVVTTSSVITGSVTSTGFSITGSGTDPISRTKLPAGAVIRGGLSCTGSGSLCVLLYGRNGNFPTTPATWSSSGPLLWSGASIKSPVSSVGTNFAPATPSCASPSHCVAISTTGIWATADSGTTWTAVKWLANNPLSIDCVTNEDCMIGATNGRILTSTDGGTTWVTRSIPGWTQTASCLFNQGPNCPSAFQVTGVSCWTTSDCMAVGPESDGNNNGAVAMTTNFGRTWTSVTVPAGDSPQAVSCSSSTSCWITGWTGEVFGRGTPQIWKIQ